MKKIKIKKNPNGDTRTAPNNITFEQFQEANDMHIEDVFNVMKYISDGFIFRGIMHDHTKKSMEKEFFLDFLETKCNGANFVELPWYTLHVNTERHHLLSNCPDDVNLFDVIEMIVDCVCAGKARSGSIRDLEISDEILKKAVQNTVKLIDDITEVTDKEQ